MFTLLFLIMMCVIFGNLFVFALKAAWGIGKFIFVFALLPIILIGLLIAGITYFAIPILIIVGIICLAKRMSTDL